ncbi:AAA family ATPase [Candidatus Manganitrophus noduliformans]|uniref:AAA family ATPase n=1 Tax=Candidatus Manganitrophus noduliformans TaxID=2606439 RepID=A0A7X6DN40_9BACT|nr:AAA family ATPase [Candidatus Manganitrophus noduliformans]NKE70129.1 AAA family ATPase [Candidatus Manganitrophus noduliformans]
MILKKLKIKNFRQYYGEQEIEFATGKKNVTVINGTTGAGKTNMFLAINWCLYGSEGIIDKVGEIVNKQAASESTEDETVDAEVELKFQHKGPDESETNFVAKRSTYEPDVLHLYCVTRKGSEKLPNPTLVLNTILPKEVRTYFLFDGEKIDDFAKPEHEKQVKQAVYGVLKLKVLDRAKGHISSVGDDYERELKKMETGKHIQELLKRKETLKDELGKEEKALQNARTELNAAQLLIGKLDEELSKQREIQTDHQRRQELEAEGKRIQEELDMIFDGIRAIGSSGAILLGAKAIQKAIAIIEEKRRRGEIPAGIREQFIRDLLEKLVCICGRTISKEGPEWHTLSGLMDRAMPNNIENRILETGGFLQAIKTKSEQNILQLRLLKKKKADLEDRLARVIKEADEISSRLMNVGIQKIEELEGKRKTAQKKCDDLHGEIGYKQANIQHQKEIISQLDQEIETAEGLEGKAKLIQKKLALIHDTVKAITEVYEKFAKQKRKEIEQETQKIFGKLIWKESQFTKVDLTDDYQLTILDRWGTPARPELSAGERQLLSLSFIMALSGASDDSASIVMDTPFGRLDAIPRENICMHLPELAEQLILFVTGTELHSKAREILKPQIGREYTLNWDKATGCTTIAEKELRK